MIENLKTDFIEEWWDRVRAGEKLVQKCGSCGHLQLHPRRLCNRCASSDLGFEGVSGSGKVYSFTTIHHNAPSDFVGDVPYTLAIVKLDEGPQMLSRLVGCDVEEIRCDMSVQWRLEEVGGKQLPCFHPD